MQVVKPHEVTGGKLVKEERNIFANTFFSFTRPKISNQQRQFLDVINSGILWEDGSELAIGLVANKEKTLVPSNEVIGGTIDIKDTFWTEPRDNGASYLDMFIEHHLFQNSIVSFGNVDEINDPEKIGGGIFRLSLDTSIGTGDVRWASFLCCPSVKSAVGRDALVQESIDNCRKIGWDVWAFDTIASDNVTNKEFKNTNIFTIFENPMPAKKARYYIEKCMKEKIKKDYVKRGWSIPHVQPERREGKKLCPIPSFANYVYNVTVQVEHFV